MVVFHSKLLVTTGGSGEKSPTSGFLGTPEKQQWGRPPKKYHSNVNWSNAFGGFPILLPIHLYVHSSICEILYIYIYVCIHIWWPHGFTSFFFDKSPVTRSPLHLTEVRKDADGTSCSVRTTRKNGHVVLTRAMLKYDCGMANFGILVGDGSSYHSISVLREMNMKKSQLFWCYQVYITLCSQGFDPDPQATRAILGGCNGIKPTNMGRWVCAKWGGTPTWQSEWGSSEWGSCISFPDNLRFVKRRNVSRAG